MPTWRYGDIIQKGENKMKILGVCGEAIFISREGNFEYSNTYVYTQKELEYSGWSLVEPKWEPSNKEQFYFVKNSGNVGLTIWNNDVDNFRKQTGNMFPCTPEGYKAAEAYREKWIKLMGGGE